MNKFIATTLSISACTLLLTACNGFFDKDNTPEPSALTQYTPEVKPHLLWSTKTASSVTDGNKLTPTINGPAIYTSSTTGVVTAINRINGQTLWQVNTHLPITTGPGAGDGAVVVGSQKGKIAALNQNDGKLLWEANVSGELLANPAIAHNVVVIKTMDGMVRGLSLEDGKKLWAYHQTEPTLVLRASSTPVVNGQDVLIGFANGKLAKLNLRSGNQAWLQPIATPTGAFSIQRMLDIDADPILHKQNIYAATYQGKIAALDWYSGRERWSHDISSYTGMDADDYSLYISDADSHVWSFKAGEGSVNWQQNQLNARMITGPTVFGKYVVVGDAEGYLHWMNAKTGQLAAREHLGSAISAQPIVKNGILYAFTNNGILAAYTIS